MAAASPRWARVPIRAMQVALVALAGYALVTVRLGLFVNAALPLVLALFPTYVRVRHGDALHPVLALWVVTAATLHGLGALGLYEVVPLFDQIAHGVSGAMVAGVGYALVRTIETHHDDVVVPGNLRFVFIVVFGVAVGVIWEVAEFTLSGVAAVIGGEPLLVQYGLTDTVLDLVFDVIGAVGVALWGTGYFRDLRTYMAPLVGDREPE